MSVSQRAQRSGNRRRNGVEAIDRERQLAGLCRQPARDGPAQPGERCAGVGGRLQGVGQGREQRLGRRLDQGVGVDHDQRHAAGMLDQRFQRVALAGPAQPAQGDRVAGAQGLPGQIQFALPIGGRVARVHSRDYTNRMRRRLSLGVIGLALMVVGVLAWAYGAWTEQTRVEHLPAPPAQWTVRP